MHVPLCVCLFIIFIFFFHPRHRRPTWRYPYCIPVRFIFFFISIDWVSDWTTVSNNDAVKGNRRKKTLWFLPCLVNLRWLNTILDVYICLSYYCWTGTGAHSYFSNEKKNRFLFSIKTLNLKLNLTIEKDTSTQPPSVLLQRKNNNGYVSWRINKKSSDQMKLKRKKSIANTRNSFEVCCPRACIQAYTHKCTQLCEINRVE